MKKQMQLVQCTVNGKEVAEYVDVRESLLDMLRNRLGLTSVKKGCEVGECGACTVIINGETIDSCIYLAVWAEGKNIRTLEGLEKNGELTRKLLLKRELYNVDSVLRDLLCRLQFCLNAARSFPERLSVSIWREISAAAQVMRILSMQ